MDGVTLVLGLAAVVLAFIAGRSMRGARRESPTEMTQPPAPAATQAAAARRDGEAPAQPQAQGGGMLGTAASIGVAAVAGAAVGSAIGSVAQAADTPAEEIPPTGGGEEAQILEAGAETDADAGDFFGDFDPTDLLDI